MVNAWISQMCKGRVNDQACVIMRSMSKLAQIETAAESLSVQEKEELLRFLAMRLRKERSDPAPRVYSDEEVASMLAEDEAEACGR